MPPTGEDGTLVEPVLCRDGYFCNDGSTTPRGDGLCPTGHYCIEGLVLPCPERSFCFGYGNVLPTPCMPGTFNDLPGQSLCKPCPINFVCPQTGQLTPELCPAGFVCTKQGLSRPDYLCPKCMYCLAGLRTSTCTHTRTHA